MTGRGTSYLVAAALTVLLVSLLSPAAHARLSPSPPEHPLYHPLPLTGQLRERGGGWPGCEAAHVPQWSGYFDIPGMVAEKHYFYWLFGPRSGRRDAPLILWMTGGPGCSSSFALLTEVGPCIANETTGDLDHNPWSWNNDAYLLFVDQPAGVGFSHADRADYDVNQAQVSEDMYWFVQALLQYHVDLRANEFFVVGESYGGHYAPVTAQRILSGNRNGNSPAIRLAGMAVGNGLTDSYYQYPSLPDMAYDFCKQKLGKPCVSASVAEEMRSRVARCELYVKGCNLNNSTAAADACRQANHVCNGIAEYYGRTNLNSYDISKECIGELCYDFHAVDDFMNRADVQAALGVDAQKWQSCNMEVNSMFGVDWFKNFNGSVAALLEGGVRVMIYAGELDFICNWIGNKRWVMEMEWSGQEALRRAFDIPFKSFDGQYGGLVRAVESATSPIHFTFVQVFDAGHMVPMDQPAAASTLITHFIRNEAFNP